MMDRKAILTADERIASLQDEARKRGFPLIRPVDAATLVILDRSGKEPRVLMGKRHANLKFMPGVFVFPGGRSEASDLAVPLAGDLDDDTARHLSIRVTRPSRARSRRLALAAIRETFEETGLVIGRNATIADRDGAIMPTKGTWADFAATGFLPDLSALTLFARAITPPRRPKRFDTRFFAVEMEAIGHRIDGIITPESELTELAWLTISETADMPVPGITRVILADLADILAAGGPKRGSPLPFYYEIGRKFRRDMIAL